MRAASVLCALLWAAAAVPVYADSVVPASARLLDDAQLAGLRGKYVPPTGSPLSGQVLYFGLALETTWNAATAAGSATYTSAANLGIDVSGAQPKVSISGSSAQSGTGTPAAAPGNAIAGAITGSLVSGVTQTIQIAGAGNAVTNQTAIAVNTPLPPASVGAGTACIACFLHIAPSSISVGVALPNGTAVEGIGPNGVFQNAALTGTLNDISNQLGISITTKPGGGAVGAAFTTLAPAPPVAVR